MKESPGIKVPRQQAQQTLRVLRELKLLDFELEFNRTDEHLVIPLRQRPLDMEIRRIRQQSPDAKLHSATFHEHAKAPPRNLLESMQGKIPENLLPSLPRSYDIIGDVAIIELSEELTEFSVLVGKAVLELNPHLRLVLRKSGSVSGTFRTRKFDTLAGSGSTETAHKEQTCIFHLDIAQVYFNPRLSHERMRIATQVAAKETIVDMFAGVGPYSIIIAKTQQTSRVTAIDMNRDAYRYLEENVFANGVADRVTSIFGDAREIMSRRLRGTATRVIMNLPSEALSFLDIAAQAIRAEGGVIHCYTFASRSDDLEALKQSVSAALRSSGREAISVPFCRAIREIAPSREQVAIDIVVR